MLTLILMDKINKLIQIMKINKFLSLILIQFNLTKTLMVNQ